MFLVRRLSSPLRISFTTTHSSGVSQASSARWERITLSTTAFFACVGLGVSTYSLTKLVSAASAANRSK